MNRRFFAVGLFVLAGCVHRASSTPEARATPKPETGEALDLAAELPQGAAPAPGLYTAGQPSGAQLAQARNAGVRTVINLRPAAELSFDEKAVVEDLGMRYVSIPIAGASDLTETNAKALEDALAGEGPFLVHCSTSNRVGALFAVRAHFVHGADLETALAVGRRHGLQGLEDVVRQQLTAQDANTTGSQAN